MSLGYWQTQQIYLCKEPIDMRKGSNSLAVFVADHMELDPMENAMFVFLNKRRDKIKILLWQVNGFWLLSKNLLKERFKWPKWFDGNTISLPEEQLIQLLDGYDLNGMRPHQQLFIKHLA